MPDRSQSLSSALIRKFLITQDALGKIESSRAPTELRWAHDEVPVARLLEEDAEARSVFSSAGWTALDYTTTQSTIVRTLMAIDDLDSSPTKKLPDDVSEANVQFLRNLPNEVTVEFTRWRRVNIDPALRDVRQMPRSQ